MASIEISYQSGQVELRPLSKSQPVSIGTHASSDIQIDESGVGVLHCRISWNKSHYEVVAANTDGVEVNGSIVRHAALSSGDVIRVGEVDLKIDVPEQLPSMKPNVRAKSASKSSSADLAPITSDEVISETSPAPRDEQSSKPSSAAARPAEKEKPSPPKTERGAKGDKPDLDDDIFSEKDAFDSSAGLSSELISRDDWQVPDQAQSRQGDRDESQWGRLKGRMTSSSVRPGEQDTLRSPFVLSLVGGALVLILAGLTFWFMIGRASSQRLFDEATSEMDSRRYSKSMQLFEKFLELFPNHKNAATAEINIGKAEVLREIDSGSPNWPRALETLERFINYNHDREDFRELHPDLVNYGSQIALGAAVAAQRNAPAIAKRDREAKQNSPGPANDTRTSDNTSDAVNSGNGSDKVNAESTDNAKSESDVKDAGDTKKNDLREVSRTARQIVERYSSRDEPPTVLLSEIDIALEQADKLILKQYTLLDALSQLEQAVADEKNTQPLEALKARRRLLNRYPEFKSDARMVQLLAKILEAERARVSIEEPNRPANLPEKKAAQQPRSLSLVVHTQSRADAVSENRLVIALAKHCCLAFDTMTGIPLWRRPIGLDTPFFPMTVDNSDPPALLMFDTTKQDLILVEKSTGRLMWRQPIGEPAVGPPVLHNRRIYLSTLSNRLYQINVDTGQLTKRLSFSQPIHLPIGIEPSHGDFLVVAGNEAVLYSLSLPKLECRSVTFLGHQPGSISAPPVNMGSLLLLVESDRLKNSKLRVLNTSDPENLKKGIRQIAQATVAGVVRDAPTLRGRQLIVTSSGERIATFNVSDDPNQPPLTPGPTYQEPTSHDGRMHVLQSEGRLWMHGSAVRRFDITTNNIQLGPKQISVGISSQPIQSIGDFIFLGRRLPYSRAVLFTSADRNEMSSQWRTVFGAEILAWAGSDDSIVSVDEFGAVFRVRVSQITDGGFEVNPVSQLTLQNSLAEPLRAISLTGGALAVASGGSQPMLSFIDATGRIRRRTKLEKPIETDPISLQGGVIVALPGKLRFIRTRSDGPKPDDFIAPVGKNQQAKWIQLASINQREFVAVDERGKLARFQVRAAPNAHIAKIQEIQLDKPLDVSMLVLDGEKLLLADAAKRLQMRDALTLEVLATVELEAPASNALWFIGKRLYVETANKALTCFEVSNQLKKLWTIGLGGGGLSGKPLKEGNQLLAALRNGEIVVVDVATGAIVRRESLGEPLNRGPLRLGELIVVPSIDGSLHHVESILNRGGR